MPGLLSFKHSGGCIAPARGSGRSPQAARHRSPRLKPAPECQAVCDSLWEPVPGEAACAPCCTRSRLMSARMAIVPGGQGAENGGRSVSSPVVLCRHRELGARAPGGGRSPDLSLRPCAGGWPAGY